MKGDHALAKYSVFDGLRKRSDPYPTTMIAALALLGAKGIENVPRHVGFLSALLHRFTIAIDSAANC